jgi:hypothetical protein
MSKLRVATRGGAEAKDNRMILIVGSTGLLGSEIVRRARRDGLPVRALAKPTAVRMRWGHGR